MARHADTRQINYDIDPGLGVDAATLNHEIPRILSEPKADRMRRIPFCRADRQDPGAGHVDPRDGGFSRAVPLGAGFQGLEPWTR
jgi:hypothetical protein